MLKQLKIIITFIATITSLAILIGVAGVFFVIVKFGNDLPQYSSLAEYNPPITTRVYASNGKLIEEYAKEKRLFIPSEAIPNLVKNAFISAEDQNFYEHPGVDITSIFRAAVQNFANLGHNKSLVGGSTITQQVVKNFLLTNEKSYTRKIKEAILSFRISEAFSKDKILELYLNQIYLGNRSYGVAAAALNYFNKSVDELTIEEAAMLAALPKAPSSIDPARNYNKALERRNWVIERMYEEGYITKEQSLIAIKSKINLANRDATEIAEAPYFAETVRQTINEQYGEQKLYEGGLSVRTTLDPNLQILATSALRHGLIEYDTRHGYRGPVSHIDLTNGSWHETLNGVPDPEAIGNWKLAVVLQNEKDHSKIGLKDGTTGIIKLEELTWARKYINANSLGAAIKFPGDVVKPGDVIMAERIIQTDAEQESGVNNFRLRQIPEVNGAIVALDPHDGKVLALSGGFYFGNSQFNRATQAMRQPGSAFKPFVYLAAMENGFSPNSIIIDEAIQLDQGANLPDWVPTNYSAEYYGPTTLRVGLEKSRNAMTVRLALLLGIDKITDIAKRFDIIKNPQPNYSLALGAGETTVLQLTTAYAMIENGGKKIEPIFIERIQDNKGKTIYRRHNMECDSCDFLAKQDEYLEKIRSSDKIVPPLLKDEREQISDPISTYQITSMLEGVIARGTAAKAAGLGRSLAGKTGTTNDSFDTWFMGFSSNLVVGVYVGFDTPKSLGKRETGASAALPIWTDFMKNALADTPDEPFRRPSGVKLVKIDATTGQMPTPDTPSNHIIYEAFKANSDPFYQETLETPSIDSNLNLDIDESGVY